MSWLWHRCLYICVQEESRLYISSFYPNRYDCGTVFGKLQCVVLWSDRSYLKMICCSYFPSCYTFYPSLPPAGRKSLSAPPTTATWPSLTSSKTSLTTPTQSRGRTPGNTPCWRETQWADEYDKLTFRMLIFSNFVEFCCIFNPSISTQSYLYISLLCLKALMSHRVRNLQLWHKMYLLCS